MRVVDLIQLKKEGKELSKEQLAFLINGYVKKDIPDYQMSAFLMATWFKGMTAKETANLTELMMNSGEVYDLSKIKGIIVDKHSTGGVGDKVSLALGPILGALGVPVAKMSGRGLGHTGGTLDKLESIPNFNIYLTKAQLIAQVNKIKLAIVGQSEKLVPADKLLYALRDVTATVDSTPLIASSIMSKKLATGSNAILLDVKCGDGAFMKTQEDARVLAKAMIEIGKHLGRDVRAEITNMSQPLGRAIGNKNEVLEAVYTLQGNAPKDFQEIIESSGSTILMQAKITKTEKEGIKLIREVIANGKALETFKAFVKAQGGDVEAIFKKDFWKPKYSLEVKSTKAGFMEITSAIDFGIAAMKLGAGRETKESVLDFEAGIHLNKKTSEQVKKGEVLFTLYSSKPIKEEVSTSLKNSYKIVSKPSEIKVILEKLK